MGKKVLVVGLAYREGVKEITHARSVVLIKKLKLENLEVFGLDPLYNSEDTKKVFDVEKVEDFSKVDLIIVVNNNREYAEQLAKYRYKIIGVKKILK